MRFSLGGDAPERSTPGYRASEPPPRTGTRASIKTTAARWRGESRRAHVPRHHAHRSPRSGRRGDRMHRSLRRLQRPSVPPAESVHRRPVEVAARILHGGHSVPTLEQPDKRILGKVLGFVPVPGDEAERQESRSFSASKNASNWTVGETARSASGLRRAEPGHLAHRRINPPRTSNCLHGRRSSLAGVASSR